jgi:hypothetical protein
MDATDHGRASMSGKGVRSALLILMDAVFIVAVLDVARVVVRFFGDLAGSQVGEKFIDLTRFIVVPLGIAPTVTAQGGSVDWDAILTVGILLAVEAGLSTARRRA